MADPYIKNFEAWNEYKMVLDKQEPNSYFHEREIWWCALGVNVGSEQDGKNENFERPVLVVRKINQEILFIVPITSKVSNHDYRITAFILDQESQILVSQARIISSRRLLRRIGRIKNIVFYKVAVELINLILPREGETPP